MSENNKSEVQKILISFFLETGLTQQDVADALLAPISRASVNQWVKGNTRPGKERLIFAKEHADDERIRQLTNDLYEVLYANN